MCQIIVGFRHLAQKRMIFLKKKHFVVWQGNLVALQPDLTKQTSAKGIWWDAVLVVRKETTRQLPFLRDGCLWHFFLVMLLNIVDMERDA